MSACLANCIGWVRDGSEKYPDGCAVSESPMSVTGCARRLMTLLTQVVICNGDDGHKRMKIGTVSAI
jgi:hypothetical protein